MLFRLVCSVFIVYFLPNTVYAENNWQDTQDSVSFSEDPLTQYHHDCKIVCSFTSINEIEMSSDKNDTVIQGCEGEITIRCNDNK